MKQYGVYIILVAAICIAAGAFLYPRGADRPAPPPDDTVSEAAPEPVPEPAPKAEAGKPVRSLHPESAPPVPKPPPTAKPAPAPAVAVQDPEAQRRAAALRYWEHHARRFDQLLERLDNAEAPAERDRLIRSMAGHVRVNTLQSLEWAMSLTDPAERRAALEAINKMSLSGIGARIEVDETGFPKIRETTVLSAVAATGQVAPGDYIVGMEDASGEAVNFEGLPARQVAQHLRGEPGSELRLQMERVAPDGSEAYSYEVTIQRSLLVIQPPF